jgi:hypothetical protein
MRNVVLAETFDENKGDQEDTQTGGVIKIAICGKRRGVLATKREESFTGKPLETVADVMAGCQSGSQMDQISRAEFLLRQTKAQIDAAKATTETAHHTKRYTRYMFWSVVILALSALGTFILGLINYIATNAP